MGKSRGKGKSLDDRALQLLEDGRKLIYRASNKIRDLGLIGERRNGLIVFLSGIARTLPTPVSTLVKGPSGSGKNTIIEVPLKLFPRDSVVQRSDMTKKGVVHSKTSLAGKILFLDEHTSGKDARFYLRQLQSAGALRFEYTVSKGSYRDTEVARREGVPTILSTTTQNSVLPDDESRFLSIWADTSEEQTREILLARAKGTKPDDSDLEVWQMVTALIRYQDQDFQNSPVWLESVARRVPTDEVRVRRDWQRFLTFLQAIAMCRVGSRSSTSPVELTAEDYCVGYRIFSGVFEATIKGIPQQELALGTAVAKLYKQMGRAVTAQEIAQELGWKESLVYKWIPSVAKNQRVVQYEDGPPKETNLKRLVPIEQGKDFLPLPSVVLKENPKIKGVAFIDPFTGEEMVW
jgi:hypothetical protein